jgi:hypothetical protein
MIRITTQMIIDASTINGGYTKKQISLAQKYCKRHFGTKKWKRTLVGKEVLEEFWYNFLAAVPKHRKKTSQGKLINPMSIDSDSWEWKPKAEDIPKPKKKNKSKVWKNKSNRKKVCKLDSDKFYASREWLELRVRVLEKYECKCMMCGRSPKEHGIILHVDHIKPRSKFPELSLSFSNLQLLCRACNLGKSNKYQTDWRPDSKEDELLDIKLLESIPEKF